MNVAFIGLGNMGQPMAKNLVAAGHEVFGFDLSGSVPEGVTQCESASSAAAKADSVITMLPNGHVLKDVYENVVPVSRAGSLFIDCSTADVENARAAAEIARMAGHLAIDAPVSGGTAGATAGSLTFMVGGDKQVVAKAEPLLSAMGQRTVHCGDIGSGQAAKMCNNMIPGITMVGTCEAFVLAEKLGLSASALFDVVSTSSGQSWSMNTYCPVPEVGPVTPADNKYRPGFAASLMLKDLELSQQAAWSSNAATPLGARVTEIYRDFVAGENSDRDFSAVIEALRSGRVVS